MAIAKPQNSGQMLDVSGVGQTKLARYGVVVLFGLSAVEEVAFLKDLEGSVIDPFEHYDVEEINLCLTASQAEEQNSGMPLDAFNLPRLQIVASVLAKSEVLSHYEAEVAQTFERIEPLANDLQHGGRFMHKGRELLTHIGVF